MWESFGTCMLNGLLYACTIRVQYQDAPSTPSLPPPSALTAGPKSSFVCFTSLQATYIHPSFDRVQSFELRQNRERYKYTGSDPGKGAGKQCDVAKRKWEENGR